MSKTTEIRQDLHRIHDDIKTVLFAVTSTRYHVDKLDLEDWAKSDIVYQFLGIEERLKSCYNDVGGDG